MTHLHHKNFHQVGLQSELEILLLLNSFWFSRFARSRFQLVYDSLLIPWDLLYDGGF